MKLRALIAAGVLAVVGVVTMPMMVSAVTCPAGSLHKGEATSYAECNLPDKEDGDKPLMERVVDILNVIVGVVGVAAVAVIIVGGIYYVVSLGDPAKATRAKNTILYGLVGLFVALLAFGIVNFAINAVFGGGSGDGESSQEGGGEGGSGNGE